MNSSTISSRYLARVVLTILTLALLFIWATEWLIRVRVVPLDFTARHWQLLSAHTEPNVVIGDSRPFLAFNSVEGYVNLAYWGSSVPLMRTQLDLYAQRVKLQRVILQADPHMFSLNRLQGDNERMQELMEMLETGFNPMRFLKSRLVQLQEAHRKKILLYWGTFLFSMDESFKIPMEMPTNGGYLTSTRFDQMGSEDRKQNAIERIRMRIPVVGSKLEESSHFQEYLVILEHLKKSGAHVCMVSFPVSPTYQEMLRANPSLAAPLETLLTLFGKIAAQHGARYLSMREAITDEALFSDSDHLNQAGAAQFSPQVVRSCFGESG